VSASSDKVYCDEPYVSIRWDSAGGWVIAEWKSWANSIEFRAACEQALLAVKDSHASRWLMDGRELRVIVEADQRWLAEDWGRGWCAPACATPRSSFPGADWQA
jgi:hypothetical protein